jgi:hypothetical protein
MPRFPLGPYRLVSDGFVSLARGTPNMNSLVGLGSTTSFLVGPPRLCALFAPFRLPCSLPVHSLSLCHSGACMPHAVMFKYLQGATARGFSCPPPSPRTVHERCVYATRRWRCAYRLRAPGRRWAWRVR